MTVAGWTTRTALVFALAFATFFPGPGSAAPRPTWAPATVVGTDPAGDWDSRTPAGSDGGGQVGQDLVTASIGMPNKATVDFTLELADLPPNVDAYAAFAVYEWYFSVDGRPSAIYGPCAGHVYAQCPTSTDALTFAIFDRTGNQTNVYGTVDQEAKTITVHVPAEVLGVQPGSKIAPRSLPTDDPEASVDAHPVYFVNGGAYHTPSDVMKITKTFVVPRLR